MLEYPEVIVFSSQLDKEIKGKRVAGVLPPNKEHKFCWFNGNPEGYESQIKGSSVESVKGFGIFIEICFDNGKRLCINDGVNVRLMQQSKISKAYQLVINLDNDMSIVFTVAMYGGIYLHGGEYENEYYIKSAEALSPFDDSFKDYYYTVMSESRPGLSLKAFLAAEQRFPGIGNGVCQDILFNAGLNPKSKLKTLSLTQQESLKDSIVSVLKEMTESGGRDTEKDIYGKNGGYKTRMSKNGIHMGCPVCGGPITKESYLGGSVYYCPVCQPID
ncbi:endonuclease VIII [Lachnospiraceae bacterium NSJ-143]|nr:endonuclease VIII [Lachnospiraceae bacterium NSJ-143]